MTKWVHVGRRQQRQAAAAAIGAAVAKCTCYTSRINSLCAAHLASMGWDSIAAEEAARVERQEAGWPAVQALFQAALGRDPSSVVRCRCAAARKGCFAACRRRRRPPSPPPRIAWLPCRQRITCSAFDSRRDFSHAYDDVSHA